MSNPLAVLFAPMALRGLALVVGVTLLINLLAVMAVALWLHTAPPPQAQPLEAFAAVKARVEPDIIPEPIGATVTRPLFWPERRPPLLASLEPEPALSAGPDPFDDATLMGVFATGPDAGVIVDISGVRQRVALNASLHGWVLDSVEPREAIFTRQGPAGRGVRQRLALERDTGGSGSDRKWAREERDDLE